jgi:hypothetical protein
MPQRIQLQRSRGWRKPQDAVVVARPTRWGNPFPIAEAIERGDATTQAEGRAVVVARFADVLRRGPASAWWSPGIADQATWVREHVHELAGRDLACWCPLDQPCHADVLLELANSPSA